MDATEVGGGVEGFEVGFIAGSDDGINVSLNVDLKRSEERRVGKEC